MAGASPRKAKRSPRQSPRVRAKAGSPGVRAKAPHESVIPASVFWSGAETALPPKATVSASSSTLGSDSRNTGAAEALEAPVPLATVDLWEAQGGGTTISTPRTLTPPQGQVRVPLQASEADVEKVETSSEASKELATASTLLAPGAGSPAWSMSRQTWSPRVSPVNRTAASTWTALPSRQSWSPRVGGASAGTTPFPPGPRGELEMVKTTTAPTASMALLSGASVPRPLLPINRVEPPLAQPTASPRYCLRRDVASAWALSSGCSSVPTPMVRECQTPASPAARHAQSLPGGATPERSSASRPMRACFVRSCCAAVQEHDLSEPSEVCREGHACMAEIEVSDVKKKAESNKVSKITISEGQKIVKAADPYPSRAIPLRALEEDDYVEAVSALIERDFFPDLPHLRARYELMQARLRGDNALAKALEKKLLELPRATPGGTPRPAGIAATPTDEAIGAGATAGTAAAARLSAWERDDGAESVASANAGSVANYSQVLLRLMSGREVVVDLSTVRLDDFQKVFTSEDNASFEAVLEKDRERRRQKEWWVEGSEEKHNTKCQALKDQISESHSTGEIMTCEFQARNTFYFKPRGEIPELIEKPTVESRNTRFTTQEQSDLDETLIAAIAARHARESGQQFSEVLAKMVKDGTFSVAALHSHGNVRAVGGRLQTPMGQAGSYPMVNTPALLPGENGFSPLMTFGKIASTPRVLDEENGPTFRVQEESARDRAADKLAKGAMQKQRESRQNSKKERLKALGVTPGASPNSARPTPASVASKVTPMTPIGQLLHRAQRMAQKGGRLRIASSQRTTPTPSEREVKRPRTSRTTPVQMPSATIPSSLMADLL